jgi:predicted dehydrogenase
VKQLGIGLVGCGFWANEMHIPAIQRILGVKVVGVASRTRESAEATARRFEIDFWTTDHHELFSRPDVDLVDILTPNNLHAPLAIEAAERGKHVICIKPLSTTIRDADAILSAAARAGTEVYYAENVPFIPSLMKAKEIVMEGGIGDVIRVKACEGIGGPHAAWFFDHREAGGGAIMDMAVHGIAFCRWMAGSEVRSVHAEAGTFVHRQKTTEEDTAVLTMRLENGVIGQTEDSWSLAGAMDSRFEVFGTKGRILVDNLHRQPIQVQSETGYGHEGGTRESGRGWTFPLPLAADINDGQLAMLEHFVRCAQGAESCRSTGTDGRTILAVVEAAYRSIGSGRAERVAGGEGGMS